MNLIQQAVERAGQIERDSKTVAAPLPLPQIPLHGVQSRSFRPAAMNPSRVPLAALGLAVLAVVGGALLYVALVRTQGDVHSASTKLAQANPAAPLATATATATAAATTATAAATAATATATAAATAATAAPESTASVAEAKAPPAPAAQAAASVSTPAPALAASPVALPAELPSVATTSRDLDDARATVESWAHAWSERDVKGYLAHYGDGFTPERGASRAAWEKSRRQMIERRRSITVLLADLRLTQGSDGRIVARYVQNYTADTYRETGTPKRLVLERQSDGWRIVAETADTAGAASS